MCCGSGRYAAVAGLGHPALLAFVKAIEPYVFDVERGPGLIGCLRGLVYELLYEHLHL